MALVALALSSELIQVDGIARRYLLAEPSGPPSVVVLSLHGSRSGPERQARLSHMAALSQEGAVVAFPQGSLRSGSGYEWDLEGDERFLRATVAALFDRYPAAHHRICMAGMSGGARMSSRLAARNPDTVMLLGPVAGLRAPARPSLERPVRVVAFHGTSDRINPFDGGATDRWHESVLDAATAWAEANGHSTEPQREQVTPRLTRISFGSEAEPGAVTLWVSRGAGHTWPGSRLPLVLRLLLGRTSRDVDATAEMWRTAVALAGRD
ncbi:MAG: alpha/beta hydrolase family esterase [Acidimicrobiales bacterium]